MFGKENLDKSSNVFIRAATGCCEASCENPVILSRTGGSCARDDTSSPCFINRLTAHMLFFVGNFFSAKSFLILICKNIGHV